MIKVNRNFIFVMDEDVYERWLEVLRRAKNRAPLSSNTDVNKRLLGLTAPDNVVTKDDIKFFQGHTAGAKNGVVAREGRPEARKGASIGKRRVNGDD